MSAPPDGYPVRVYSTGVLRTISLALYLAAFFLGGCAAAGTLLPGRPSVVPISPAQEMETATTALPTNINQIQPTPSQTSLPGGPSSTGTSDPARAQTVQGLQMGPSQAVGLGGFAFQPPGGYLVEINVVQATVSDPSGNILLTMTGTSPPQMAPAADLLAQFLENMGAGKGDFAASAPYPLTIAGIDALAADVRGILFDKPFTGRVAIALPSSTSTFNIMCLGLQDAGIDHWAAGGESLCRAVLASIEFFEPTDSACPVSDDPSYGYSPGNPIRVGDDAFGGPARQRAYLDNLRGPNFEPVVYERLGADSYADTILDRYTVSYPGGAGPALLYLDGNQFAALKSPVGFKCPRPFDIRAP